MQQDPEEADADGRKPESGDGNPRVVTARELLGSARTLRIEHAGSVYTLRLTRNDRLILTK